MPFVFVHRNPAVVSDKDVELLNDALQIEIAKCLTCDERKIAEEDVTIFVHDIRPLDRNAGNLHVLVTGHNFASREATLEERKETLTTAIRGLPLAGGIFGNGSSSVYVTLAPAGFGAL